MTTDAIMARILDAVALHQRGDNDGARGAFAALWDEIGADGDALHRCTLGHYMADVAGGPAQSLLWNQRALDAAAELTDDRLQATFPTLTVAGFLPSLHLNLAEDFCNLGRTAEAMDQLRLGEAAAPGLPDDGYGALVRGGLARLRARLARNKCGHDGGGLGPGEIRP